ncbi:MAG: hypothetical protein JXR37_14680 [Kiritimatiellae bacterium]|nr:hypothetical protein [Kiritimatiellia bacterium]
MDGCRVWYLVGIVVLCRFSPASGADYYVDLNPPARPGDPQLLNPSLFQDAGGKITVNFPSGLTIAEKVQWLHGQFRNALGLQSGSGARDVGTPVSYVDPRTGATVSLPFLGSAPDIGAYEFAPGGDTMAPRSPTGLSVN